MPQSKGDKKAYYTVLAALALSAAFLALISIAFGEDWVWTAMLYGIATCFRLGAGREMNMMGGAATVNAWNNNYHRFLVIVLNSVVGFVLLGRLVYDWFARHTHGGALVFLAVAFAAYFIAAKFTAPNTFGARVRSATLTVALLCTMAYLAWDRHWGLWVLVDVIMLNFVWLRLRALQRRFGWANR